MIVSPLKKEEELNPTLITVQMLGGFQICINGRPLDETFKRSKQVKSLLCYLLLKRFEYVSQERLIEILWSEENSEDPSNALKNLIYRLRKILNRNECFIHCDCIINKSGTYGWNNQLACLIDAEEMDRLYRLASDRSLPGKDRVQIYLEALSLYKGGFLSDLNYDDWVVPLASYYQNIYLTCLREAVRLLYGENRYQEVVNICEQAIAVEPYEEFSHENLIRSLIQLGKKTKALEHYQFISNKFYKDLGVKLAPSIRELYKELMSHLNQVETDLHIIKEELSEIEQEGGAFYCDYEVFKHLYRLEARSAERAGQSVFICLLTLCHAHHLTISKEAQNKAMETLKEIIIMSLRKGDVVSRFSVSQYVLMLPTTSFENGEKVLDRILRKFRIAYQNPSVKIKVTLEPIISVV